MRLLRQIRLLLVAELRQEIRSFEVVLTSAFFSLVMLALFALSLGAIPASAQVAAAPGALWLSVAFVGGLTLTRVFDRERESDTLRALLVAPVDRLAIYFAKAAIALLVLLIATAVLVPGLVVVFPAAAPMAERPLFTAALVVLGCVGYVAVGTLFAAGLATGSGKNVLLSLILHPLTTPVLMFNLVATRALLEAHPGADAYLGRMAAVDVILVGLGAWLFEPVLVGGGGSQRRAAARPGRGA
ncbi:MAG: heme exporter protein CcmB [Myxococcales bacterium]|nr:heme exporter protein CcmB [Myxococcales bacterium]MCB9568103.1 heme exporter protein CcmB [Myxococcales bacterium]MCB9705329.1 heme exporter protein CcmB [Myxococcales bacterium]